MLSLLFILCQDYDEILYPHKLLKDTVEECEQAVKNNEKDTVNTNCEPYIKYTQVFDKTIFHRKLYGCYIYYKCGKKFDNE